ncbi:Major facilitator superfamily domain-containing 4B5 [Apodemus speciosus]|uniref:Major facilitator superfamily domain-containing 4B5 n=1 Tax=Apodemus speciosus TaxID=105296 RepID=A0ABQ0F733_APOSI
MESCGSGAMAAEQHLLQAETPGKKGGQVGRTLRWFTTVVLNAAFLGMGVSAAVLGPTFPDLARNVNRNVSSLSEIFVGRALGYLSGSVVGGVLFDCMNHFLLLGLSNLLTAAGLYLTPFCKTAALLTAMMSVTGVSFGVLDTGGNVLILALWGDKGAPHMQALHFSFALGAFLAPLLAKLAWGTTASAQNYTEPQFDRSALNQPFEAASDSVLAVPEDMNLLWAYVSIGTYVLVVSVFLFAPFFKKRSKQKKVLSICSGSSKGDLWLLRVLLRHQPCWHGRSEAAGLNSVFWGTFAACRGLAIFFATRLQPGTMIVLCNIGSLVATFFLVLFDKSPLCLWIASSVYGASMAATFPSGISWIEQYTTLTGKSAAFILIGAALGLMATPALSGILQGHYPDLPVILYTCLGSAVLTTALFPLMYKVATLPLDQKQEKSINSEGQKILLSSSRLIKEAK